MEHDSKTKEIRHKGLLGLNERLSPDNSESSFDVCRGLYPSQQGLLSRLPGSRILLMVGDGTERIFGFRAAEDGTGNIFVQTDVALYSITLDELRRGITPAEVAPDIIPTPITDEDAMSMAIIVQKEANTQDGGSIDGFLSGTSTALTDTMYGRRLTHMLINQSSTVVTFTASTGGSGAVSMDGTFELSPGTYRITAHLTYCPDNSASPAGVCAGLYNVTDSAFETYDGSVPILATVGAGASTDSSNYVLVIDAGFTVSTSNKTFQISQKARDQAYARNLKACGKKDSMTGANVNAAAATQTFAIIKILKTA